MIAEEKLEMILAAREDFKEIMRTDVRRKILEIEKKTDPKWATMRRIAYLKGAMAMIIEQAILKLDYHLDLLHAKKTLAAILTQHEIKKLLKEIVKIRDEIFILRDTGQESSDPGNKQMIRRLSREEIERAKEHPFYQLVELQRNGMALCPFHEDHDPSFSIKNNYGYCFGCGWKGSTIDFVMQRYGKTFATAVRELK